MSKKDFPRFSEATIKFGVTQPQMKLILASISYFHKVIDGDTSPEVIKSFLAYTEAHYGFKLTPEYQTSPDKLILDTELLLDALIDPFTEERWKFIEIVNDELNDFYTENFDPEILCLREEESLKVENVR